MPYNIWCGSNAEDPDPAVKGCRKHIGMGVRYNAEKTKIGMYYTTPVYQFKFGCHYCQNPIIIKTDPGNMDYVIVQGARRVEQRWDPTGNGQVVPDDKRVGRKLADDAMFKLEHENGDQGKQKDSAPRIAQIYHIADRVKNDYMANRMLRDKFREAKKERSKVTEDANKLKAKAGLSIDIVAERETDIRMARLLSLQAHCDAEEVQSSRREGIGDRDIFEAQTKVAGTKKELALHTLQKAAASRQANLRKQKGFGIIVKKLQHKDKEFLQQIATPISPRSISSPNSSATSSLSSPSRVTVSSDNSIPNLNCISSNEIISNGLHNENASTNSSCEESISKESAVANESKPQNFSISDETLSRDNVIYNGTKHENLPDDGCSEAKKTSNNLTSLLGDYGSSSSGSDSD